MFRRFTILKLSLIASCAILLMNTSAFAREGKIDFIENKGQWGHGIRYQAEIPGGKFFLTNQGFVYNFVDEEDLKAASEAYDHGDENGADILHFHAYRVNFVDGNVSSKITGQGFDKRSYYHNYFIGNDSSKWQGHVGLFGKAKLGNIYDGIDIYVYNGTSSGSSSLKYDFVVGAGVSADQIKLSFDGVTPTIDNKGDLVIQTTVNKIVEQAPYCYQEINGQKVMVSSKYVLTDGILSFAFPNGYNQSYPLVIDPNLIFATYSGGTGSTYYAFSTTFDDLGNTYATGAGSGTDWPTTIGAYQTIAPTTNCVCLNVYTTDGSSLVYSTYFGGSSGSTLPNTLRVDNNNNVVIGGSTTCSDLPVTTGAYQSTNAGGNDIFISKLSSDGSNLLASTYIGGTGNDATLIGSSSSYTSLGYTCNPVEIAFDSLNNVWITSNSSSNDFPVTNNAYQSSLAGGADAVVLKLSNDFTNIDYSTYIGGTGWDGGIGLELDDEGNPVFVGMTSSTDFPATSGALNTSNQGGEDGFVARLNSASGALINATYLGTAGQDEAERLNFDCEGNVFVAGRAADGSYPVTAGSWNSPNGSIFVHKLSPDLSSTIYSTTIGESGSNDIVASSFMVDMCGNVVIGVLNPNNPQDGLELTPDAFQTNAAPFYLAIISSHFNDLEFGSYYGTNADHYHPGVSRLDKGGAFYQSVCCANNNYPTTPNAFSPDHMNSSNDVVTFKFDFDVVSLELNEISGGGGNDSMPHAVRGCKPAYFDISRKHADTVDLVVHFQLVGSATNGTDYEYVPDSVIIPAYDTTARIEINPLLVSAPTGTKIVHLDVFSPCGCGEGGNSAIIASSEIKIYDSLYVEITTPPHTVCANTEVTISADIDTSLDYSWSPAALIPDSPPFGLTIHPKPSVPVTYTITATQPGAPATCPPHSVSSHVTVEQYPDVIMPSRDTIVCINPGDSVTLNTFATPEGVDYNYSWDPAANLRDDYSRINKFAAPVGTYKYVLTASSPLANCTGKDSMTIHVVPPFQITSVTPSDTVIDYGDAIQLNAIGDAVAWVWLPVDFLDDPNLQSPVSSPNKSIQYEVVGLDKYGCRDTGKVNIQVQFQPNFFIPTAFSPNGDGHNDMFRIENLQYEKLLTFKVFNRLGQLVFSTKNNINGWDGTFNGKPAPSDTYFYLIEVVLPDGEHQKFKGDITLVR